MAITQQENETNEGFVRSFVKEIKNIKARKITEIGFQEKIKARIVFLAADEERHGDLQREVANTFLTSRKNYPETILEVLKMLNNYHRLVNTYD